MGIAMTNSYMTKLESDLMKEYGPVSLSLKNVSKCNGVSYTGLSIKKADCEAGPVLNLDSMEAVEGKTEYETLMAAAREALSLSLPALDFSYEEIRDQIIPQLLHKKWNREYLGTVPHHTICDLAVVYRVILDSSKDHKSCVITNGMMEHLGVTRERIATDTINNLLNSEYTLCPLSQMMFGSDAMDTPGAPQLWVGLLQGAMYGASVILNPEFLQDAADKIGGSFYILPSSIHEVLLLKNSSETDPEELRKMIQAVNGSEVDRIDQLSDHPYYYDAASGEIRMA